MSEQTLKSFSSTHTFLKNNLVFSAKDLLARISGFETYNLDSNDKKIVEKIIQDIHLKNLLPVWWSEQESSYISRISSYEKTIKYLIFRHKFRTFPMERIAPKFPAHIHHVQHR